MEMKNALLSGVVGSTAYGLAHEGSDVDRLGIFAHPTEKLFGLGKTKDSIVSTSPDVTWHEAAKALRLILACNPTSTEILWLESYETSTYFGEELVALRSRLLSARGVRNSYLGYASQQLRKLQARMDENPTSAPSRTQSAKHARHLVRLLEQGTHLHQTGELIIRLENPDYVREMGEIIAGNPLRGVTLLRNAEEVFSGPGVLPDEPDLQAAEDWLVRVRCAHLYGDVV